LLEEGFSLSFAKGWLVQPPSNPEGKTTLGYALVYFDAAELQR
jgi:hypothetical protein